MRRFALAWLVVANGLASAAPTPPPPPPVKPVPPPPPKTEVRIVRVVTHQTTSLDQKAARRKVAGYLAGVRRCYLRVLDKTQDAAGDVTIQLTVNAVGQATAPAIRAFDRDLSRCLTPVVKRWRFPIPLKFAEPTTTKLTIGLALAVVPDEPPPADLEPPTPPRPAR